MGSIKLLKRLKSGLAKTRQVLTTDIDQLFSNKRKIDDDLLEELEELLITSDLGVRTTMDLMDRITTSSASLSGPDQLKALLKENILHMIQETDHPPVQRLAENENRPKPYIIMVVGVNGSGKTTTIGKLAAKYVGQGNKVLLAAGDTFRAAAAEQLTIWAERAGAELVKHRENTDPAAVVFDGIEAALARNVDIVLIDTAGRMHTNVNLMAELKKIKRTIAKKFPAAPHEILMVLDATTGQNATAQAQLFHKDLDLTGLVLTKLDGTAKGGIVVSICRQFQIPLKYIGIGEGIDDLQPFDPEPFVEALF